ncbi:helix-turn-helix domain-containing protein [Vibrio apostichopi]|uniref:helix-turn-helix domain-containing protein n=1 Tax=Vibrio apostichopi TaxID=3035453 RepID=UPI002572CFA7|nr:helix-turn-helix transcriptional regulator [Vibrio sp. FE10]
MAISFARYLQNMRKEQNLTQQEVLEFLVKSNTIFTKLDLTTLSRWERGVTVPKLTKQLLVARCFGTDVAQLIDPIKNISVKKKKILSHASDRTLNPYSSKSTSFSMRHYSSLDDENELCELLQVFHFDYLGIDIDIDMLKKRNLLINTFIDQTDNLIGHLLYGFVPSKTEESQLNPNNLSECTLIAQNIPEEEPINMYLISGYSFLSTPRMVIILNVINILRKNTAIKYLYVNCHNQFFFDLYSSNVEFDVVSKGNLVPFGGVKLFGKHYSYVQLKLNAHDILASKVIADLVPFTDEYLQDLLDKD